MSEIILIGWMDCEPGDRDIWLEHAPELSKATLEEPGCFRHVIAADPHSSTALITHSHYASLEALNEHVKTAHMARFVELTKHCRMHTKRVERFEAKKIS